MKPQAKRRSHRYYDTLSLNIPAFAAEQSKTLQVHRPISSFFPIRGILTSLTKKADEEVEEVSDEDIIMQVTPRRYNTIHYKTQQIKVLPALMSAFPVHTEELSIPLKNLHEETVHESQAMFFTTEVPQRDVKDSHADINLETIQSQSSSAASSASSTGRSDVPPKIDIKFDRPNIPEIPLLATNLVQLLATIPDSPPASLSPYTFCEEVGHLEDKDFEQFLEEDTLFIKSAIMGQRFTADSVFDFFTNLSDNQYSVALKVVLSQYLHISRICKLIRELISYDSIASCTQRIEKECADLFGARMAILWVNIPSGKSLINYSRLLKYPHGVGFVGTAASEKRQVLAPNPMTSPLYDEEYDLPFCEDSELILVEPILNPATSELYAVLMLIDKFHHSGASYLYWPQSEITLLRFFSSRLYRVFEKFKSQIKETSEFYKTIGKFMSKLDNLPRLLSSIQSTVTSKLNCESLSVFIEDEKNMLLFENSKVKQADKTKMGIAGFVMQSKTVVNCPEACTHQAFNTTVDGFYQSRPVLAVPLMNESSVIGALVCRAKKGMPSFTTYDLEELSLVASGAASAISMALTTKRKNAELRAVLRAQDKLAALLQTAESLSRETNIDTLVGRIIMNAKQLVDADRASLFVVDDSHQHLISKVAHGTTKALFVPINSGISGHVATSGEIVNIADVYEDSRFNSSVDKETGYKTKSLLTVPVKNQTGQIIAVTQLMNKVGGGQFSDKDVELTKAMCVFTGIAIANSIAIQSALNSTKRTKALLETSQLLLSGNSLTSVLHTIMSTARDLVQADRCALFLVDRKKSVFSSTVAQGEKNPIEVAIGKGIVGYIAEKGETLNIPDAYKDKRFNESVDLATGYRTRSILGTPVKDSSGTIIGVVEMINKYVASNGGTFTDEDEKLTTAFASFAGLTFDHRESDQSEQNLAISVSNLISAEESESCSPPVHLVLQGNDIDLGFFADLRRIGDLEGLKLAISMFFDLGLCEKFQVRANVLIRFLLALHNSSNWSKALWSAQFCHTLIKLPTVKKSLSELEQFALMVSAFCHNIGRKSSADSEQMQAALSVLFRNQPYMEVNNCERTVAIISQTEQNIFERMTDDQANEVWQLVIKLILSTDMSRHFEIINQASGLTDGLGQAAQKLLLMEVILKCSDLGPVMRKFHLNEEWANALDGVKKPKRERALEQVGFICIIARPLIEELAASVKEVDPLLKQMESNLTDWKARADNKL